MWAHSAQLTPDITGFTSSFNISASVSHLEFVLLLLLLLLPLLLLSLSS